VGVLRPERISVSSLRWPGQSGRLVDFADTFGFWELQDARKAGRDSFGHEAVARSPTACSIGFGAKEKRKVRAPVR